MPERGRGDLVGGVVAPPVVVGLVVHLAGRLGLLGSEFGFLSAGTSAGAGSREPVDGALGHHGVLELGDGADDREEQAPDGGRGVDALIEHHEIHLLGLELFRQLDEVFQGAAGPVGLGDTSW